MRKIGDLISTLLVCAGLAGLSAGSGCDKRAPGPGQGGGGSPTPAPAGGTGVKEGASRLSAGGGLTRSTKYEVVPAASPDQLGTLEVTAVYTTAEIPVQAEVPVNINVDFCNHKVVTENLIVDKETRGLKNVVVRLEGITKGSKKPPEQLTLLNQGCTFVPHVSVAVKDTRLEISSEDPVLHTTHPYTNDRHWFNITIQKGERSRPRPFRTTGLVEFNCDVHKWMRAYTLVHASPYVAVSDAQGKISLDEIPPGEHPYVAWHEQLGEQRGTIKIEANKVATLKLEFELAQ